MKNVINTEIAVIGGGASGLAAAISALECGADVVIAEKLDRVGKKLLATGNGRCNLSNSSITAEHYHGSVSNIMKLVENCRDTEDFFRGMGLLCVSDAEGRMYPRSNSASSVLDALRLKLNSLGGREICGFEVAKIIPSGGSFRLLSENGKIKCRRVIVAAGGYAAPAMGTDGSVIRMLRDMGYRTSKLCPAVAPLKVDPAELKGLKGVRVKCAVTAIADGKALRREEGELQFTDGALSGICIFNMARFMSGFEGRLSIAADLCPDMTERELEEFLFTAQSARRDCEAEDFLTGLLTKKLAVYIMKKAVGKPLSYKAADLKYPEIQAIARCIKRLEFKITGSAPWQSAQVTSGGIHGSCIDGKLGSTLHRGIYFCGEILDVDGDCGGYNLQWAWSSGRAAGKNCAQSLRTEDLNGTDK